MQLFCEQMRLLSKTHQPQTAVNMSHKIQINDKSVTFQRIELQFCSCEHDTIDQVQLFLKALYVLRLMHTDQKSFEFDDLLSLVTENTVLLDGKSSAFPLRAEEVWIILLLFSSAEFDLLITVMDRYPAWSRVKNSVQKPKLGVHYGYRVCFLRGNGFDV